MKHQRLRRYFRHGTLTQFAVFEAVARHSSFTRAAEELHMAQPTVSVLVKKLTETVGMQLFETTGKQVRLTAAGREILAACQDIFLKIAEIDDRLGQLRTSACGSMRIAVSTTGKYFAPRLLGKFWERHPGVELSLAVVNRENLLHRLAMNMDDLYIFSNPPEDVDVVMHPLLPNPMLLYAPADHPLAKIGPVSFADIAAEPFLMREPGSGTRLVADQLFAANGVKPRIRMELGSNEAIKQAILCGLGISLLSRHTMGLGTPPDGFAALDVEGFPLQRWWYLVYPETKRISPTARAFVDELCRPDVLKALEAAVSAPAAIMADTLE